MNNTLIGKTFLRLGLVSFGGPTAHIGYFRDEFVKEKKWLLEDDFSSLLAICQALPGPTSSQMVFSIGLKKGGFLTAYIALIAFSFLSVFLMILLGLGYSLNLLFLSQSTITAVSVVAIPVVGMAVFSMFRNFCRSNFEKFYFFVLTILLIFFDLFYYPTIILIASWLAGAFFYDKSDMNRKTQPLIENINKYLVYGSLIVGIFVFIQLNFLLIGSIYPSLKHLFNSGFLIFGGGHVVLPLLHDWFVDQEIISSNEFFLGYGFAQAIPGPLFSFASYLGIIASGPLVSEKILMGLVYLFALYGSTLFLTPLALYMWVRIEKLPVFLSGIKAVNIAVSAILCSCFLKLVLPSIITGYDSLVFLGISVFLIYWFNTPIWGIVILLGAVGYGLGAFNL